MKIPGVVELYTWLILIQSYSAHKEHSHLSHYLVKEEDAKSFLTNSKISKRSADLCVNDEVYCETNKPECRLYTERSREAYCRPDSCPVGQTCYMTTPCPAHYRTGCDDNACLAVPCKNGGTCTMAGTTYTCSCTTSYYGETCTYVDKCLSSPCENGGTCRRAGSDFNCNCTNEHQGPNCQNQSPCYGQPCKNGATCRYAGTNYICACISGFYGVDCESVDKCISSPCANGGTCRRVGSDFNCDCTNEHQGPNCQHQSPCYGQPCKNGATCRYAGTNYICACISGFYGVDCESDCRPGPADIIIVLDSSTSTQTVFNESRSFTASFVEGLPIVAGDFRIAMLTYSVDVNLEFGFNTYTNKTSMISVIANISNGSGASYLHKALGYARQIFRSEPFTGVKQYVIIISDGLSTRRQESKVESRLLKNQGVTVLCVGIGSQVAQEELLHIATDTPYVFSPSHDDVRNVILMETVDTNCTDCLVNKDSDIVLLVDVSKYQSGQLHRTLDTVKFFIQQVRAYFSDTRIAMVTFDVRQHVTFGLTDDQDTDGILVKSQIGITTNDQDCDVRAALAFVRNSVLSGARGTSRKFVVVFSNEGWTDVDGIVRGRQALNMDNVTVAFVPVGLSDQLDTVYSVAKQASDVYYVGNDEEDHDEDRLKALVAQTSHVECVNDLFDKRQ